MFVTVNRIIFLCFMFLLVISVSSLYYTTVIAQDFALFDTELLEATPAS